MIREDDEVVGDTKLRGKRLRWRWRIESDNACITVYL